jgi:hypothetical protein
VSTRLSGDVLGGVLRGAYADAGVAVPEVADGVEVVDRGPYRFVINHTQSTVDVAGERVPAGDVAIRRRSP